MTAIAIIVAALLLGHDISKAIDRLTDAIERIQESLGSFLSDQGWSQSDMDTADALGGLLAAAPQPPAAAPAQEGWCDGCSPDNCVACCVGGGAPAQAAPVDAAVQQDAERWQFLAEYLVGTRTDLDDEIVGCDSVQKMAEVLDAARQGGAA